MSIPIIACRVSKAALGDEVVFNELVEDMKYNLRWGAFSRYSCQCDPPCPIPSDEQLKKFNERMDAALKKDSKKREKIDEADGSQTST